MTDLDIENLHRLMTRHRFADVDFERVRECIGDVVDAIRQGVRRAGAFRYREGCPAAER